jgi:hypothetical protein
MGMVNMLCKHEEEKPSPATVESTQNETYYPYGLSITLEKYALAKIGMDVSDFTIGDELTITAKVEVTGLRESESESYTEKSVDLQITDLDMGGADYSKAFDKAAS